MDASQGLQIINPSFEINRVYKASMERVWRAWSERDQLGKWWGPKGCTVEVASLDFREGGLFHYAMKFEGAPAMWGRFSYREIAPNKRIVWLNSFATEYGGIARAPFSDLCPLEIENAVTFTEQASATTVTLRARPFGASAQEIGFFAELCSSGSLAQGYGGTFDQLAEHLSRQ